MSDPQEPRTVANMPCPLPPEGWYCTRPAGHDGPCAAVEYPQEPRTGGVAVWRLRDGYFQFLDRRYDEIPRASQPGTWFPLAEAEALIDPNDPAVIERAERAVAYCIGRDFPSDRTAWTILAALRSKGGTDAR